MKVKVLDKLFLKGFIGPCLLAFFVVEFVLIMQNLWKVIDDILGKGYGFFDYAELLYYFAVAIIPTALPLTILLSSVMVYGDMAEKYELSSAKSSGISFTRMLYPGLIVAFAVFGFSIIASNYLKPRANEGFHKKIRNMRTNKLTFVFDEKIFNQEFKDFSIRVGKKYKDGRTIDDVMIYDHSDPDNSVLNMIRAKTGAMYTTSDMKYLVMDLQDGYHIKEIRAESADRTRSRYNDFARPVMRFSFSELRKTFDLTEMLDLNVVNISYKEHEMMGSSDLIMMKDSLRDEILTKKEDNVYEFDVMATAENESLKNVDAEKISGGSQTDGAPNNYAANATKYQNYLRKKRNVSSPAKINLGKINSSTSSILSIIDLQNRPKLFEDLKKTICRLSQ